MSNLFTETLAAHKSGKRVGLTSVCSAHPDVLIACAHLAAESGAPLIIESTCNQVNQDEGYTGLTPAQFARQAGGLAAAGGLPPSQLILGGDHLGPYPWRGLPAEQALEKARRMTVDYVLAGYTKIHLDASMRCAGDPPDPLPKELIAARSARLALAAEQAYQQLPPGRPALHYVIGTEVPTPGGSQVEPGALQVTHPADAAETLAVTRLAFTRLGLEATWERVAAMVVQPGVEFGDEAVHVYDPQQAAKLAAQAESWPNLVFEAHSTDYQPPDALQWLVRDHFAILKVGPALTFAYREAIFALEAIEAALAPVRKFARLSHLRDCLEDAMLANPDYWRDHYSGPPETQRLARQFSFSDRARYYWFEPQVATAVECLFANLSRVALPLTLLSQYLPLQYAKIRSGRLASQPRAIVQDKVAEVLAAYLWACGVALGLESN